MTDLGAWGIGLRAHKAFSLEEAPPSERGSSLQKPCYFRVPEIKGRKKFDINHWFMNTIITIDGPAGSGKSTVSRMIAEALKFFYLDTGAMYRAVALQAKREGVDCSDKKKLQRICKNIDLNFWMDGVYHRLSLGDEDISLAIRTPEMDMLSSKISTLKEVRDAMKTLQRELGRKGRVVAEGRDMGTVVFPEAEYKFFLTASPEIRAERRYKERRSRGELVSMEEVIKELRERDNQDTNRDIAPLRPAEDAKVIDSTALNQNEVAELILKEIKKGRT
jgi:CMP/dCMP kinase